MSDDNQKFLDKFKSQISRMGKDGILGTDNNISSISSTNNTINSNFNNPKAIFKNSLSDKNNLKKGSAFLKPINKAKININSNILNNNKNEINDSHDSKNNNQNDNIDKFNNKNDNNENKLKMINNPYLINNQINQNGMIYNPSMFYYQNPFMYMNYNQNKTEGDNTTNNININNHINNNINNPPLYPPYQPYQLYYYSNPYVNNNNNNIPPYIPNITNIPSNLNQKQENNIKMNKKKKLRPISAQVIGRTKSYMNNTNTTINTNYGNNKSNITTVTNINNSKFEYKPYTLKDYKEIMNVDTLGGLGANIGTEEWEKKKEKMDKMSEYAKNIFKKAKNKNKELEKGNKNKQKKDELSTRKRANEYSKLIRPKSTGQCKIIKQNKGKNFKDNNIVKIEEKINENSDEVLNKENNKLAYNNMNILQGKYALIHNKRLNDEKINNINNFKNKDNNEEKNNFENNNNKIKCKENLKDIFNENSDEDDEEKKLMEYYNKFKISSDIIIKMIIKIMMIIKKKKILVLMRIVQKEQDNKRCIIKTIEKDYYIQGNLHQIESQLDKRFIKCNRSYIINLEQVESYDIKKNILKFKNGIELYAVSRNKKKEIINYVRGIY